MSDDEAMNLTLGNICRALEESGDDFMVMSGKTSSGDVEEVVIYARGKSAAALNRFYLDGGLEEKLEA